MRKQYKGYLFTFFSLAALVIGMLGTHFVSAKSHTQGASPQKAAPLTCGTWSIVTSPNVGSTSNVLSGVEQVPGSSNVWAVGHYYPVNSNLVQTLIEVFC